MKTIVGSKNIKKRLNYPVLTLGNFDGVHKGHLKIIKKILNIAKRNCGTGILYTFDPHPVRILAPHLTPPILQTIEQKKRSLEALGLDALIIEPFTKSLAKIDYKTFFNNIICKRINPCEIVVGYDFTFGEHRLGKVEDLEKLAIKKGIKTHIIDAIFLKESLISSTHIRHFIERGELQSARSMLGRPYSIEGVVIKGRGIGAELGYHTANLKTENELIPPPGVYITTTQIKKTGKRFSSVTNIGYNPTFKGTDLSIETHLLSFKGSLIKRKIEIDFFKKIRREMTFESIENLRIQIGKDISSTRRYHAKRV